MIWADVMTPPDEPVDKTLWWMCPCGCKRWIKQKSKAIADRLKKEKKVKTKGILIKEVCVNFSCPFWDKIGIHKHD